jgi:hypothetical protein
VVILGQYGENFLKQSVKQRGIPSPKMRQTLLSLVTGPNQKIGIPSMKRNENANRFSIGTIITKYWNGLPYKGIFTSNTDKYYKILYEDNDEEKLNHTEVDRYIKKNRGEGRMTM